jgi:hypothetical protein
VFKKNASNQKLYVISWLLLLNFIVIDSDLEEVLQSIEHQLIPSNI